MKKRLSLIDFTIRWIGDNQYVDWAELKNFLWVKDYLNLLKFINKKKVHCQLEGLQINVLKEFLDQMDK